MGVIIEVKDLSKKFKTRTNRNLITGIWDPKWQYTKAVYRISFEVERGESVAFLGPNGAGKTTTTKMLTGLIYPSEGSLNVLGYEPFNKNHAFLKKIGLVMGNKAGLNWDLTANQSFWMLQKIYEIDDRTFNKRVKQLSRMLNVHRKLDQQVRRLSLGERMKVELMGAILHNPEVLFLDEPTIGLDIEAKKTVREFLKQLQKEQGTTIILTSHDMDDIEEVSERVLVINEGEIVYDDSIDKLTAHYNKSRYVRFHFKDDVTRTDLRPFGRVVDDKNGILLKVPSAKMVDALAKIPAEHKVDDINIESIPLETIIADIFAGKRI